VTSKDTVYMLKPKVVPTPPSMFSNNILNNLFGLLKCLTRSWITKCELYLTRLCCIQNFIELLLTQYKVPLILWYLSLSHNSIIKVKDSRLYLFLFYFYLFLDLELEVRVMSHMTVTNCHTYVICYSHKLHNHILYKRT